MGCSGSCFKNINEHIYKDLNLKQPDTVCCCRYDTLKVEFKCKDLLLTNAKKGLKLRPVPVKNGNFIAWECTEVVIPSVEIPKQKKREKNPQLYTVAMVHCCSKREKRNNCFSDIVPHAVGRRCFEDARSHDPYDENNVKFDLSFYAPPFTQFVHWLKINFPAKRKKTITDEEPYCNTVIRYAPLGENCYSKVQGHTDLLFYCSNKMITSKMKEC